MGQDRNQEIQDILELNENEYITYPNLRDTMKAVPRGKLIAIDAKRKKLEQSPTSDLTHLKVLEKKSHPKVDNNNQTQLKSVK